MDGPLMERKTLTLGSGSLFASMTLHRWVTTLSPTIPVPPFLKKEKKYAHLVISIHSFLSLAPIRSPAASEAQRLATGLARHGAKQPPSHGAQLRSAAASLP